MAHVHHSRREDIAAGMFAVGLVGTGLFGFAHLVLVLTGTVGHIGPTYWVTLACMLLMNLSWVIDR